MTESIRSVRRALQLMRVMNAHETWTLNELAAVTALPKTTVHRLLATLEDDGYVHSPSGKLGVYRLTTRTSELSAGLTDATRFTDAADPIVIAATRALDWPVTFAIPDPPFMRVIACGMPHSPEHSAKPTTYGQRRWMFEAAMGRAYLSGCSAEEVASIRREAAAHRPASARDLPIPELPELMEDLRAVRSIGYAVRIGGVAETNSAVAVPVGARGRMIGALVCSTFSHSLSRQFIAKILDGLRATAAELAEACLA